MSSSEINVSQYISRTSSRAFQDFLRPQSSLDRIYLITLALWFTSAIFISQESLLRVFSFVIMIITLFLSNFEKKAKQRKLSMMGSAIKLFIIAILISFFTRNSQPDVTFPLPPDISYLDIENILIASIFILAIILNGVQFSLMRYHGFQGYLAFLKSLMRGIWLANIGIFMLIAFNILRNELLSGNTWEKLLLYSLALYLCSSLIPYTHNSITNLIIHRNSFLSLRDCTLGASITLIILNFIFHKLTLEIWDSILPLLFIASVILYVFGMEKAGEENALITRSISRTKEMARKISELNFDEPEEVFITNKATNILKNQSTKMIANQNSLIIPLSKTKDSVAVEVVGKLELEAKDAIGRIKNESVEKMTFVLSNNEWLKLKKGLKPRRFLEINLSDFYKNFNTREELIGSLKNSLSQYKEWSQTEGILNIQQRLQLNKSSYGVVSKESSKEINFPGVKAIEGPDSFLVKIGPIQSIDVKKQIPGLDKKAKFFNIKMPFVASTEFEINGRYFMIDLPGVSVLETPKGTIIKIFGYEFTEGNKLEILEDLNKMLTVQERFEGYFESQMLNMLSITKAPKLLLMQKNSEDNPKLLMTGVENSVVIKREPDLLLPLLEPALSKSEIEEKYDTETIIEVSEDEMEILGTLNEPSTEKENLKELKLKKIKYRVDKMTKNEFMEYMEFESSKEFLDWLANLPDESKIKLKEDIIYFN